jgi:predicted TIM-barrel fold metal-dependent hydrolase
VLPGVEPDEPRLHWDLSLDPFWSALEETGLVANAHAGAGLQALMPAAGLDIRVLTRVLAEEFPFFARRAFTLMMWSGVFERHPRLKTVWTEQYSDWIPRTLDKWEWSWNKDVQNDGALLEYVPRNPREYWKQNCWSGMSVVSKAEVAIREEIGLDKVMFGVDFPHIESTFPKTLHTIQTLAEGVPDDELRAFLGLNAAKLWQLDLDALAPVVAEVGFTLDEIRAAPPADAPLSPDVRRPLASC